MASYLPHIKEIVLSSNEKIPCIAGSITFVVGPNNGGKSTFLRDLATDFGDDEKAKGSKWIKSLDWELGEKDNFDSFIAQRFVRADSSFDRDLQTNAKVLASFISGFYDKKRLGHTGLMIRSLTAESRIQLSNQTNSPDVLNKLQIHPYHAFFYDPELESEFSRRIEEAFGHALRVNRTGPNVIAHLGKAPNWHRLSEKYERHILTDMKPINQFGDGIRSYVGILLNSLIDPRPVTIIDEPEAFLHPPQAFRLGKELATHNLGNSGQAFIATHSADFIKGSLSVEGARIQFLYLDHEQHRSSLLVPSSDVHKFQREPFLVHTDALDALFYSTAIVCEADADIMFFKYALSSSSDVADNVFWVPSYGKTATPQVLLNLKSLGVNAKCVFDIDVLLTPEILYRCCDILSIDILKYKSFIERLPSLIKLPPAAEILTSVSRIVGSAQEEDTDASRVMLVKDIKKAADGLSRSWSFKAAGLRLLPKGQEQVTARELIDYLAESGIVVLREGEIENYAPEIGGHGRSWVRSVVESDGMDMNMKHSLREQFKRAISSLM